MYVALPSSRMNSSAPLVDRPDRVTRKVGLIGRERGGRDRVVSDVVHYCPASMLHARCH